MAWECDWPGCLGLVIRSCAPVAERFAHAVSQPCERWSTTSYQREKPPHPRKPSLILCEVIDLTLAMVESNQICHHPYSWSYASKRALECGATSAVRSRRRVRVASDDHYHHSLYPTMRIACWIGFLIKCVCLWRVSRLFLS